MQNIQPKSALTIALAWQDAANAQEAERLLQLSDPDIEIVGPRGSAYGHQILRDWLGRAGLTLMTLRTFMRGELVVVAQHGVWHSVDDGAPMGEADIASRFRVAGDHVTQYARHDNLDDALAAAGLTVGDEVGVR